MKEYPESKRVEKEREETRERSSFSRQWIEDAIECDKPVTLVCSRYEKKEERPLSLIHTCQ